MKLTAKKISNLINGKIQGDSSVLISSFASIKKAKKGDVTFLSNKKYEKYIKETKASLIITPKINIDSKKTIIQVTDPVKAFANILDIFQPKNNRKKTISKHSKINKNSKIGKDVFIGAFSVIEDNVEIGNNCIILSNTFIGNNVKIKHNCRIGPNVTIYENCKIGKDCIIHAGAVIGSDGFGFVPNKKKLSKMPQAGRVIIEDNVEIGSNTTIDRGTLEDTKIASGAKLDNLIQIGHNVNIGRNTLIAAQCGIAGSSKIGENCMIGGQVAVADHIIIGDNVKIAGKSGIIKNVSNNKILQGSLAFEVKDFQKSYVHFKNLGQIVSELNKLKIKSAKNNKK